MQYVFNKNSHTLNRFCETSSAIRGWAKRRVYRHKMTTNYALITEPFKNNITYFGIINVINEISLHVLNEWKIMNHMQLLVCTSTLLLQKHT